MKIAIMQPYIFPYIGYFQLINCVDLFVVYDDAQFIKSGWINRNNILLNNKAHLFTFSVKNDSFHLNINQRQLSLKFMFEKDKFIKKLHACYNKAPNFNEVICLVEQIFDNKTTSLALFLTLQLKLICSFLDINTEIILSSEIPKDSSLKREEVLIEICNKVGANQYINSIGGETLYTKEYFSKHQITLSFLRTKPIVYPQFTEEHVSFLSIIDVMMFNSKEKIKKILNEYELI